MGQTGTPLGGVQGYVAQIHQILTRLTNLETWQRSATAIVQPGTITQWGGSTPPAGALQCNGASFSGSTYPQLEAALGSTTLPNITGTPMHVIWTGPQASV